MRWLQRVIHACREGDFGHYGMLILISLGILATFTILGCGGGAVGGGGCGGTTTVGSVGNYTGSPPTVTASVTTSNPKNPYQPNDTVTLVLKGSWSIGGAAKFRWEPPAGASNFVFREQNPVPGGPPFLFNEVSEVTGLLGITVSYSAPASAPQGKFSDTLTVEDGEARYRTAYAQHLLPGGTLAPPLVMPEAPNDPQQQAAALGTWTLMQMTTVEEAYTEADCFNMMTQGKSSNLFMAYRVPVDTLITANTGYVLPLSGSPSLTLNASGGHITMPLEIRPDATNWANDNLPAAPGALWVALGLNPGTPINCPATGAANYSLETFLDFDLSALPQSCEGCTLYTDICYTNGPAGTPALVEDLAKTFGPGFRAINVGDHTCVGPAETILHANSNWQLDAQTSSFSLKPGDPVLMHYILYNNLVNSQTFSYTHTSALSGANWVARPALAGDPTKPDLTKTITSPFTLTAGQIIDLYITGTVPANAAADNYTYALNLTTSTAGAIPASTRGSTLLIVTSTGTLPEMRSPDAAVALNGTADLATVRLGQPLTYQLIVRNSGAVALTDLVLTNTLPANTTYVSCSGGDSCALAGGTVTWNLANLGAGQQRTMTLTVKVNNGLAKGTKITNSMYAVQTGQGVSANGSAIQTTVDLAKVFLPMVRKQ